MEHPRAVADAGRDIGEVLRQQRAPLHRQERGLGRSLGRRQPVPFRPAVLGQADAVADERIALLVARRHQAGRGKRLERERERPFLPFPLFFVEHDRQMQHLAQAQHGADAEILEVGKVALPANVGFGCPERKGPFHPFAEFAGALRGNAEHVRWDARLRDKADTNGVARNGFDGGMRRPVVCGKIGGTALHGPAFAALPFRGMHLRPPPARDGAAIGPGVAGGAGGHARGGHGREGMPELIKQCHALPPHPCEYDSGAATPGVERRKLALKVHKLLADLGQVVPGQGAALNRVRLARGRRLVRGLPTGDQIEEFFTCPDGAHSVLHSTKKCASLALWGIWGMWGM